MNRLVLFNVEINCYNGFIIELLSIDCFYPINIDSSLLGLYYSGDFLYIDILFIKIKVFESI